MSADSNHHDHHDEPHHVATFKGYMTGFVLSVILTAIPFALVMGDMLDNKNLLILLLLVFGGIQIVVHVVYFLHMDAKAEQGWTLMSFIFTGALLVIMLVGSIWIMSHLKSNTHPALSPTEARQML